MTARDHYTLTVTCPQGGNTGTAHVWEEDGWSYSNGDQSTHIETAPDGFSGRKTDRRPEFTCLKCGVGAKS